MDQEAANIVRWTASGHPRSWLRERKGAWSPQDLDSLIETLKQSEFWPLHVEAVRRAVEKTHQNWWVPLATAIERYPFLLELPLDGRWVPDHPPEVSSVPLEELRAVSLLEDLSEGDGYDRIEQQLYIVRSGRLQPVDVIRVARHFYPPDYIHPEREPPDEWGSSETVAEALARQDLKDVRYLLVHSYGDLFIESKTFNRIAIAAIGEPSP